jgi:hypothetical protein
MKKSLYSKIRHFLLFVLFFGIGFSAFSQENYIHNEAMAPVKINNHWGYIDKTGKLVIPARYNQAGGFTEGTAPVRVSDFWGYIDKTGKWALKPIFTQASNFSNKRAMISIFETHDSVSVTGYMTPKGELLYELEKYEVGYDYHDHLVRIRSADTKGMAFGFRDTAGEYKIKPKFDGAMDFSEGVAAIMLGNKWGFVNAGNDFVIFPSYDEAYSFTNGLAYVRAGSKKTFINKKGKTVINLSSYEEVSPFMYDEMIAVRKAGKLGFVNHKGKLVVKPLYENPLLGAFNNGLAAVAVKNTDGALKWGYINKTGEMVIPATFEDAGTFYEDRARVKINGKYGFIDKTGKLIGEAIYDDAFDFTPTY